MNDKESNPSIARHIRASLAATIILTIICCGIYPLLIWGIGQMIFAGKANGSLVGKDGAPAKSARDAVGSSLLGQAFTQPGYFHPRPSAAGNGAGGAPGAYSAQGGYDPTASGATNYGPTSDELLNGANVKPTAPATQPAEFMAYDGIRLRAIHYALDNGISFQFYHARYQHNADGAVDVVVLDPIPRANYIDSNGPMDVKLIDDFPHAGDADDRVFVIAGDFSQPIPGDAVTASGSGLDPHISPANARLQSGRVAAARKISVEQVSKLIDENTDGASLGMLGDAGVNVLMLNLALDKQFGPLPTPKTIP